jgi:hypothetical protein
MIDPRTKTSLVRIAALLVRAVRKLHHGSTGRHLIRMSFSTDFTPATPRATLTAWSMSA